VRNAADELRVMGGREIPMGLTPASIDRRAFTIVEPIGIVAAMSAFNHPLSNTTLLPSIIVNPPRDAKVSTLEVFGRITCVYPFTRLQDAVAAANSLPLAFQASIFTEDLRTAFDASASPPRP
jgi:acyl-CoA reductase-like NAD-dependent aldehyde dehydrogenase